LVHKNSDVAQLEYKKRQLCKQFILTLLVPTYAQECKWKFFGRLHCTNVSGPLDHDSSGLVTASFLVAGGFGVRAGAPTTF
jgi:hypothetical protein